MTARREIPKWAHYEVEHRFCGDLDCKVGKTEPVASFPHASNNFIMCRHHCRSLIAALHRAISEIEDEIERSKER